MDYGQIWALISALAGSPEGVMVSQPSADNVTIKSCPRPLPVFEIEGKTLVCGTVTVPEDRTKPEGRKIDLEYAVLKAESRFPEPDPVVYLEGGPGGSAVNGITLYDWLFKPWRQRRDIVIFDQRSAGISGSSVNCYAALSANALDVMKPGGLGVGGIPTADVVGKCVGELKKSKVQLELYNTTENAKDVSVVVSSLGYKEYNIYGISYGTKLALEVMRSAPEQVRSVVIDGVAPPWIHLYDSAALKNDEVTQNLVNECAADPACNEHFPDLGRVLTETMQKAKAGEIQFQGQKVPLELVVSPILARNGKYRERPTTKYVPAFIYELWRGKEMPTVEKMLQSGFSEKALAESDVLAVAAPFNAEQKQFLQQVLDGAAVAVRGEQGVARGIENLRNSLESTRTFGPVARMFDQELGAAMLEVLKADKAQLRSALADYTAMQTATPSKDVMKTYVNNHVGSPAKDRLLALIDSMTPAEVDGSFAIIRRDSYSALSKFLSGWYLDVYACQEDRPYNNIEGYQATIAKMKYPDLAVLSDGLATAFYESCKPFYTHERPNWHEPVESDIPTLSFGSSFDIQTPASWARMATEKLSNAQVFMIPEAGHGAVAYQPCVAQMGVAFFDNPKRKFDNSCAESIKIDWHIPDWAKAAK
jgi:pimeloyl-ACP methyl ester carboxylesterase